MLPSFFPFCSGILFFHQLLVLRGCCGIYGVVHAASTSSVAPTGVSSVQHDTDTCDYIRLIYFLSLQAAVWLLPSATQTRILEKVRQKEKELWKPLSVTRFLTRQWWYLPV